MRLWVGIRGEGRAVAQLQPANTNRAAWCVAVSMAERPWHNCSALSIVGYPGVRGIHSRKAVAQLQRAWHVITPQTCQVSMAERPWHSTACLLAGLFLTLRGIHGRKAVAQCSKLDPKWFSKMRFQVSMAEGRADTARKCSLLLRSDPCIHGRKAVAQLQQPQPTPPPSTPPTYPWPKGRGTIAAGLAGGVSAAYDSRIHGRKAVAQLQPAAMPSRNHCTTSIHGRKAVAQLQRVNGLSVSRSGGPVSMAERPWHNCSAFWAVVALFVAGMYPWPKGRGTIAANSLGDIPACAAEYPWPKGRGTIAASAAGREC